MVAEDASAPPPFDAMAESYRLACQDYVARHKSQTWDIFSADYNRLISDHAAWTACRRNGIAAGMDVNVLGSTLGVPPREIANAEQRDFLIRKYQSLLAEVDAATIDRLSETDCGDPAVAHHQGRALNVADLRLTYNANSIATHVGERPQRTVFVEIGGGFGGLALKLKRLYPRSTYVILDLPEVCAIQTWYLHHAVPGCRIVTLRDVQAGADPFADDVDFALLPGWYAEKLPAASVDVFINIRSMMEMNRDVIADYFRAIHHAARPGSLFYCANRYMKMTGGVPIRVKDYPFDDNWYLARSQTLWDQDWVHELVAVRTALPNVDLRRTLAALPPVEWAGVAGGVANAVRALIALTVGGHPNINPGLRGHARDRWRSGLRWASGLLRMQPTLRRLAAKLRGAA